MPKHNRKRRHEFNENDAPRIKTRPFNNVEEAAQAEEEQLSKILFGGASNFLKSLEEAEQEQPGTSTNNIDSGVGETDTDDSNDCNSCNNSNGRERQPAWYDEDDGIEVGRALKSQHRKLPYGGVNQPSNKYSNLLKRKYAQMVGTPSWASLDKNKKSNDNDDDDGGDDDDDDEILRNCGFLRKSPRTELPSNLLQFKRVTDINRETYCEGPFINTIEFHPTSSVALIAGNSGIATLYAVDGKTNNKLHSVAFERFPIYCGKFYNNGKEAILGSNRNYFYIYDLMSAKPIKVPLPQGLTQCKKFILSPDSNLLAVAGKWGEVHILTATSKERIALFKQDSEVTDLCFNPQGNLLYGHCDTGEITIWDMNTRRIQHKFIDDGCLNGTKLTISPSNQFLAAGSAQGVVNLYDIENVLKHKIPKPRKTILNLTTSISDLKFNQTSEILSFCSVDIQNAVKLYHIGSGTVFSNFPMLDAKLGHVNCINFSPSSGFVAFGNRKSKVPLFRLKHYNNY